MPEFSEEREFWIAFEITIFLYEQGTFGTSFIRKLNAVAKKKFKPLPHWEIQARLIWLHKMYDRASKGDLEGNYRRSWLHEALLSDYFALRKMRYSASKRSFEWLKNNDSKTYELFERVLENPLDLKSLKILVRKVSGIREP